MPRLTQCDKILNAIRANGSVTSREMIDMGIFKYSSRIADLRKKGYNIRAERVKDTLYRYLLEQEPGSPKYSPEVDIKRNIQEDLGLIVPERKKEFRMI